VFNFWAGALFEYEKGRRSNWEKPTNRRPDFCLLIFVEHSALLLGKKGTDCAFHSKPANQGVRIPTVARKPPLASMGSTAENRAFKNPQTVDAVGVQPTASILFCYYGAAIQIRTGDLILTNVEPSTIFQ
jgi:hypothetical protein